jgi:hypothetical protein
VFRATQKGSLLWSMRIGIIVASVLLIIFVAIFNHGLYSVDYKFTSECVSCCMHTLRALPAPLLLLCFLAVSHAPRASLHVRRSGRRRAHRPLHRVHDVVRV